MAADHHRSGEDAAPIRVWLECDLDADPIEGTLTKPEGTHRSFTGWLGLTAALERLRAAHEPAETGEA